MEKKEIGRIAHYYPKINVAVVELTGALNVGDRISIESKDNAVEQTVDSMQIEHSQISAAKAGQAIGLKVADRVHEGSKVYKLVV